MKTNHPWEKNTRVHVESFELSYDVRSSAKKSREFLKEDLALIKAGWYSNSMGYYMKSGTPPSYY